jgi:putative membrane protein
MNGGWGVLMVLSMVAFWALLAAVGVALYRLRETEPRTVPTPGGVTDAEEVLARRFAVGEIDESEYAARLAVLREQRPR